jgi:hypothetical protein
MNGKMPFIPVVPRMSIGREENKLPGRAGKSPADSSSDPDISIDFITWLEIVCAANERMFNFILNHSKLFSRKPAISPTDQLTN